ncbi:helix-turn-helix transcriptional regulator [Gymnodinialimonas sp. 2305UL16-5]|uniref:helix-turn-helix transcriptional regulator n=1 Tax=Gymnodinialimonas mytili TaxID=3126503 RepID=UPI0030AE2F50
MLNYEMLESAIEVSGFAISCFALILSALQIRHSPVYTLLAVLFLALVISDLFDMTSFMLIDPAPEFRTRVLMISYASSFFIPPALLVYVRALTGEPLSSGRRETLLHLTLPGLSVLVAVGILFLSVESQNDMLWGGTNGSGSGLSSVIGLALIVLVFAFYLQCLTYVVLTMMTQIKHRERLKDLFASTEPHEIRWITGMAVILGSFAVLNLIALVSDPLASRPQLLPLIDRTLELLIVLTLGIWGLRQSPGIAAGDPVAEEADHASHVKYEKSALSPDRAARISDKLKAAMATEHLFRDPNLSLMILSKHIGVSTNYVSQSLNEHMGVSFFDFVNTCRVEEAKSLILAGEQPVTIIAYEVGFNSRSSFYTAFKKNTGMTPKEFKTAADLVSAETV